MIFKAFINPETLEVTFNDSQVIVNHVRKNDGIIEIEISKPDPEPVYPLTQGPITP